MVWLLMFLGLDHTGLAVRDLEAARARFAALGFLLTPREVLSKPGPAGTWVSSGADNHVFMMKRGYQELITITDPESGHMLLPRLQRYWGLHIVVIGSNAVDADHDRLAEGGLAVSPCMTWGRLVSDKGQAQFRFFSVADQDAPEAVLAVVQHLNPDILRPAELLEHPNGAAALNGCILHVADLSEARARYARLFGPISGDEFRFPDGTFLRLADRAALAAAFPGAEVPSAPAAAAIEIAVTRMERLIASGVRLRRSDGAYWLDPGEAFGAIFRFVQS